MTKNTKRKSTVTRGAYSPQELANYWGKSRQHIYNLIGSGVLHSFKVGRSRLIPFSEIERIERGGES